MAMRWCDDDAMGGYAVGWDRMVVVIRERWVMCMGDNGLWVTICMGCMVMMVWVGYGCDVWCRWDDGGCVAGTGVNGGRVGVCDGALCSGWYGWMVWVTMGNGAMTMRWGWVWVWVMGR